MIGIRSNDTHYQVYYHVRRKVSLVNLKHTNIQFFIPHFNSFHGVISTIDAYFEVVLTWDIHQSYYVFFFSSYSYSMCWTKFQLDTSTLPWPSSSTWVTIFLSGVGTCFATLKLSHTYMDILKVSRSHWRESSLLFAFPFSIILRQILVIPLMLALLSNWFASSTTIGHFLWRCFSSRTNLHQQPL